jgi:transcriptional regulator with XRE-family HTH domain
MLGCLSEPVELELLFILVEKVIGMAYSLAKRIRDLRRGRKLTAVELGERLGVSETTISKWECGHAVPRMSRITTLARALGVSVPELWALETKKARKR